MPFDLMVVDLDNTLYAADSGVFARMDARMTAFVARELSVDAAEADALRLRYWRQYGTTLRGLILHHDIEPEGFLHDVHDVGVHDMLTASPELDAALARVPVRKVIHTNGTREHAERVIAALGVAHHFSAIYDIRFDNYRPKPSAEILQALIEREGVPPARTIVADDMEENLSAARSIGAQTALVSGKGGDGGNWDFQAADFPELCGKLHAVISPTAERLPG